MFGQSSKKWPQNQVADKLKNDPSAYVFSYSKGLPIKYLYGSIDRVKSRLKSTYYLWPSREPRTGPLVQYYHQQRV